jgi:glucosamine--fructose-6-phosphate aminotransferase (isomerizing)
MNKLMRNEILDQPKALALTLNELRSHLATLSLDYSKYKRIIFIGSGDSYFAPLSFEYAARNHLECFFRVLSPNEAAYYWKYDSNDLVVPISVSGESNWTIKATEVALAAGVQVLSITGNQDSSLSKISHATLILPFKSRSRKTPHTTDYSSTLMALAVLIESFSQKEIPTLNSIPDLVSQVSSEMENTSQEIARQIAKREIFYFLGAGPNFGTTQYAVAKFWETGGIEAFYFELEEFAHAPMLVVNPEDPVFVIAPDGKSTQRAISIVDGLLELGTANFVVTNTLDLFKGAQILSIPRIDEMWSPFVCCVSLQWLCWAIASEKGYDVVKKDGRHSNPELYDRVFLGWVRASDNQ